MAEITPSQQLLTTLTGKITLLTGGANGIGAATVRLFSKLGSKVAFCDLDERRGRSLEDEIGSDKITFYKCDTTNYQDLHALFEATLQKWGRIDVVVANAGLTERGDIFAETEDFSQPPPMAVLDVNLKGVIYTARLGVAHMRKNGGGSLVLVSSIAGFKESPGLWVYQASKHGVLGLMRCMRLVAPSWGIHVNAICPWMTKTGMVLGIEEAWITEGIPTNEPSDVALAIALTATANNGKPGHVGAALPFNGKGVYVTGGKFFEFEDNIDKLEPQWLGEENSRVLARGQALLGGGAGWTSKQ